MRKIEEVLRLHFECGRSNREIAAAVRISPTTAGDYLRRAKLARLGWPLPEGMTELALEAALFPAMPACEGQAARAGLGGGTPRDGPQGRHPGPALAGVPGTHPDGYQYSAFCEHYRAFALALPVTLRQSHAPGERLFVDYSGQTVPIIDPATGEIRQAQFFVAVLGASNYTFVEATWSQGLADWTGAHVRCFEFLGGVPAVLVPDNLRAQSPPRTSTTRWSIPPTRIWPPTMAWRSCPPESESPVTRRRLHIAPCSVDSAAINVGGVEA